MELWQILSMALGLLFYLIMMTIAIYFQHKQNRGYKNSIMKMFDDIEKKSNWMNKMVNEGKADFITEKGKMYFVLR